MTRKMRSIGVVWIFWAAAFLVSAGGSNAQAAVDPITGAEPAEGFGANATGGYGKPEIVVTTYAQFVSAIKLSNVYIKAQGDFTSGSYVSSASNITIDGQGATSLLARGMTLYGQNIVIKNLRIRHSGDNISLKSPCQNVLISHVTSTASKDDGISISYGTKNVTVQYSAFFGCTRSIFIKYDVPQNISLHHNWIKGQWIRGPLISSAKNVDVRNQLSEDWALWGGPRFETGSTGNCVNSVFVMTGAAAGKLDAADFCYNNRESGVTVPTYTHGHLYRNASGRPETFTSSTEIPCAPVTTHSAEEAEAIVRASAGCLPRDAVDLAYIAATSWPPVGETTPWIIMPSDIGPSTTVTGPPSPTTTSPIVFSISFGASVTGFTVAGITVTNGTKGLLTGSGAGPYLLPVTPMGPGPVTCKVNAGAAQDSGGKNNMESNTLSIQYDASEVPEDFSLWMHRETLRFAGFTGSETLTSFPLLVRLDGRRFPPEDFEPEGADLRFADADGKPIPYEIESWDRDGQSLIWVAVPQITSSDDYIEMFWGRPGALSRARPANVWTNDFLGVWHLESALQDSSAASRDAVNYGVTVEEGIIGPAAEFDGASYLSLPASAGSSETGSLSVWIQTTADFTALAHVFYLRGPGGTSTGLGDGLGGQNELHLNFQTTETLRFFIEGTQAGQTPATLNDVIITTPDSYADGQWHHVAATWQKPGTCNLYVNGELKASAPHTANIFNFSVFAALGKPETNNRYYTGLMDEARLESAARSADWIRACYLNQKLDSTFFLFGDPAPAANAKDWGDY